MKLFNMQKQQATQWLIEVDYGSGWFVYGPPYPRREPAESLARELRSHGHDVRVTPVELPPETPPRRPPRSAN